MGKLDEPYEHPRWPDGEPILLGQRVEVEWNWKGLRPKIERGQIISIRWVDGEAWFHFHKDKDAGRGSECTVFRLHPEVENGTIRRQA